MKCYNWGKELKKIYNSRGGFYCPDCNPEIAIYIEKKKAKRKAIRELNKELKKQEWLACL